MSENGLQLYRKYFRIAGITIAIEAGLPITNRTFNSNIEQFHVEGRGNDTVYFRHHFALPDLSLPRNGKHILQAPPWTIHRNGDDWVYTCTSSVYGEERVHQIVVSNGEHSDVSIFHAGRDAFLTEKLSSLSLMPTDQILLARLLAARQGCYLHASGAILDGRGFLFAGRSGAGKSSMLKMLAPPAEILCDDRLIVRRWPDGFKVHGTWSHGEIPVVSPHSAPLRAILFLRKSNENRLDRLENKHDILSGILACLIKPLATADWWERMLDLTENLVRNVPFYTVHFDRSGKVLGLLEKL